MAAPTVDTAAQKRPLVDLRNLGDVRAAFDDALRAELAASGFRESHRHSDAKLLLGYLGCAVAISASAYGYFVPYPACRRETQAAVALYVLFSALWTAYALLIERDVVYVGVQGAAGQRVRLVLRSTARRYDPALELRAELSRISAGKADAAKTETVRVSLPEYFTCKGRLEVSAVRELVERIAGAGAGKRE